ncbi:hypothetical protein EG68_05657 [Paragonimus skrjabini miyazakii]|uniref:Uncharacterized protein n=1 Tax=Paragonimus skrjabini miyazakii TaxID=59628 RepID=A0A8S9YW81_9TREM|nr:hypothetical protein EG68_05657 [Paragonimus skrjabini miyazakii]
MCRYRLRKRELTETTRNDRKPCCLPDSWKARFIVHSVMSGKHLSRVDHGAFRMRRWPDGSVQSAILVVGKSIASPEFCYMNTSAGAEITEVLCPNDKVACLHAPYLGEPRCLTETNGYKLKRSKPATGTGRVKQTWFIDRINRLYGTIERHIYHVVRQYGLCRLLTYQIQWGNYVLPWKTCRLFVRMEKTFNPVSGTFELNFDHNITDKLLFC